MTEETTTSRVLRLLSLLQSRRSWPGTELAGRVGVTPRTIRRDIDRLRELGYRIAAERGAAGGYRLEAGSDLPPLLFSSDEAMVLAIALRASATGGGVRDRADVTVSVLAKLEQVLPATVQARIRATQSAIVSPGPTHEPAPIDPEAFAAVALACRDREIVRFDYRSADATSSSRRVEPNSLVPVGGRWYLLAWDTDRRDWRTFRVDRIAGVQRTHVIGSARDIPDTDAAAFVLARLAGSASPRYAATIRISAPLAEVEARMSAYANGFEAAGESTLWRIADDRLEILFGALAWLTWPFEIAEGEDLRAFAQQFRLLSSDRG